MIPVEKKMTVKERQLQAVNLRKKGFSYERIARLLKFRNARAAYNSVSQALQKTFIETAEEFRNLVYARLEMLLLQISPRAIAGDLKSANLAKTIITQEAKLYGLMGRKQKPKADKKKVEYVLLWDSPEIEDKES
jgi:hypothetical protein